MWRRRIRSGDSDEGKEERGKCTGPCSTGRCLNNVPCAKERDGPDEPVVKKKTKKKPPFHVDGLKLSRTEAEHAGEVWSLARI